MLTYDAYGSDRIARAVADVWEATARGTLDEATRVGLVEVVVPLARLAPGGFGFDAQTLEQRDQILARLAALDSIDPLLDAFRDPECEQKDLDQFSDRLLAISRLTGIDMTDPFVDAIDAIPAKDFDRNDARAAAAHRLVAALWTDIDPPDLVPRLVSVLRDSTGETRTKVAEVLLAIATQRGDPDAFEPFLAGVKGVDFIDVAEAAVRIEGIDRGWLEHAIRRLESNPLVEKRERQGKRRTTGIGDMGTIMAFSPEANRVNRAIRAVEALEEELARL